MYRDIIINLFLVKMYPLSIYTMEPKIQSTSNAGMRRFTRTAQVGDWDTLLCCVNRRSWLAGANNWDENNNYGKPSYFLRCWIGKAYERNRFVVFLYLLIFLRTQLTSRAFLTRIEKAYCKMIRIVLLALTLNHAFYYLSIITRHVSML